MSATPLKVLGLKEFLAANYPKPEPILGDWLCRGEYVLLSGPSGAGKSLFALALGLHLACGTDFLGWVVTKPLSVLLVDGEMGGGRLQERIRSLLCGLTRGGATQANRFDVYPLDAACTDSGGPLVLSEDSTQQRLVKTADDYDIVILDNFYCFFRGDENEAKTWQPVNQLALELRSKGKTVVLIHHVPKSRIGAPSGHSMNERSPDTSLVMVREREDDIQSPITLKFRKLRHVGDQNRKTVIQYQSIADHPGAECTSHWRMVEGRSESPSNRGYGDMIQELRGEGKSFRSIESEIKTRTGGLGPSKSSIAQMVKNG